MELYILETIVAIIFAIIITIFFKLGKIRKVGISLAILMILLIIVLGITFILEKPIINITNQQNDLAVKGYELSGHKEETSSNAVVTAVSYSTQSGYGTAMDNDVFTYDTYTFSNNTGDIVEIELKYRDYYSKYSDVNYIQTVELLGCKTSKAADYNDVCGNNSMTKYLLQNINRDIDVEVYNHNKTMSLYSILLLGLSFSPLLLLL